MSRAPGLLAVLVVVLAACANPDSAAQQVPASSPSDVYSVASPDQAAPPDPVSSPDPASSPGETASPGGGDAATEPITVMLDWTPNTNHTGLYVAQAQGWYAEAGLQVAILQPGEQGSLAAVASGAADVGVSVQEEIIPARAQGVPVVSIAAIIASNTSSFLALADEGIDRPADFAGHRYGGFGGQLETALVRTLVECDGGDPDAVEFVEVGNVDYRVGLERDFYDFVWIFEGWDGIRLREIPDLSVTTVPLEDYFDCIPDWYTPLLATSERMITDQPQTLRAFLTATARGYEYATANPDAAADLLLEAVPELDPELVSASQRYLAEEYAADGAPWGQQSQEVWERFAAFLDDAGLVDGVIDVDAAYTNAFLPSG